MAIRDREALRKSYEATIKEFLARMPLEERLKGLTPEEIAKVVTSDEVINALPPEAREALRKKLEH